MKSFNLMALLGFLLALIMGLCFAAPIEDADLVLFNGTGLSDSSGVLGWDPSLEYRPGTMAQLWIGKAPATVGQLTGSPLYGTIYQILESWCPDNSNAKESGFCKSNKNQWPKFTTKCHNEKGAAENCDIWIDSVKGKWTDNTVRRLLIGSIAGALESLSNNPNNCYDLEGKKACNVGDVIRVNFPIVNFPGENNMPVFMYIAIKAYTNDDKWNCCGSKSEPYVEPQFNRLGREISQVSYWKGDWSSDVRCIINGDEKCPK